MSNMRTVEFQYGEESIHVNLPADSIISFPRIKNVGKLGDEIGEFIQALHNPIGSTTLAELASTKSDAVVVICDRTRPMPTWRLLPIILDELNGGGLKDEDIKVIIALGTHRGMTKDEIQLMVGSSVLGRVSVMNHDWDNPEVLVSLGQTPNGTWIDVNREVYEADLVVGLSSVKPHRAAGWSGGGKIIDPGVCGKRTIDGTHYLTVDYAIHEILGVVDNPIRKEIEDVAGQIGLDFSINLVLNGFEEIVNISAGDYIQAHRKAVEFAERIFRDPQTEKADFMICGAGEWGPDFWGAVQAIFPAEYFFKDGGTVVFFANCPEGFCPEHLQLEHCGYRLIPEIKEMVSTGELTDLAAAGHISAVSRIILHKNVECILVSEGISRITAESVGLIWEEDPQKAVAYIFEKHGPSARGYLFSGKSVTDTVVIPW